MFSMTIVIRKPTVVGNNHTNFTLRMSQLRNQGEVSKTIILKRNPLYGLGFAISDGKDNPAVLSGDTSLIISDVIKGGPAWNRLQVSL